MKNQVFQIAGGGIAGIASALAVAGSGQHALVMEKAIQFEALGAGLQLGPNAVRALQRLGAWDAVEPITSAPPEILIRDGRTGKTLKRLELGRSFEARFGAPYRVAHRADLLQALLDVAKTKPNITIQTNTEFLPGAKFDGFALIAADGVWSKIRDAHFPNHKAIIVKDVIHRSLSETSMSESVNLWLYPGGHVVHYPVGKPARMNLVAVTQSGTAENHYSGACDELREVLRNKNWSQWPAAYVPPLQNWSKGNMTLIGDAAHGTLPYLAQGAAMALEDAATLGEILELEPKPEITFQSLNDARLARTKALHEASLQAGKIYHMQSPMSVARNAAIKLIPSYIQFSRMAWIYDWQLR
jgi:salicylate hydroxylase